MDDKHRLPLMNRPFRRNRPYIALLLVILGCYTLWRIQPFPAGDLLKPLDRARNSQGGAQRTDSPPAVKANNLVPLEAHIMSKCPDAKVCLG
jgi:hypothetical protein